MEEAARATKKKSTAGPNLHHIASRIRADIPLAFNDPPDGIFRPRDPRVGCRQPAVIFGGADPIMQKTTIVTALVLASSLAVGIPASASAKPVTYDGTWSVRFVTESGACDSSYDYTVAIQSGAVRPVGSAPARISGGVGPDGQVALDIRHMLATADASGRLQATAGSGSGKWRVSTLGCTGRWMAQRRLT
jgi:hypothetical protein